MAWRDCNDICKQKPQTAQLTTQPRLYSLELVYMSRDISGRITVLFVHAIKSVWVFLDLPSKKQYLYYSYRKHVPQVLLNFTITTRQITKSNRLSIQLSLAKLSSDLEAVLSNCIVPECRPDQPFMLCRKFQQNLLCVLATLNSVHKMKTE